MDPGDQRTRILQAAVDVVAEKGLDKASVRAVASAAGVGMGTLRHYFPTQQSLHEALVFRLLDDAIDDFDIHDETRDPGDRLAQCILQFLPADADATGLLEIWFGLYRAALGPGANGLPRQFLETATARAHARIASWLQILAREGHVGQEQVTESVMMLGALVSGLCLELLTPGSTVTLAGARSVASLAARSVVTSAGKPTGSRATELETTL
jgi:AcrR family transcriptional regulator